jgi:hypothetical protein
VTGISRVARCRASPGERGGVTVPRGEDLGESTACHGPGVRIESPYRSVLESCLGSLFGWSSGVVSLRLRWDGRLGASVVLVWEELLFLGQAFAAKWFTPIVWAGYILLAEALVLRTYGCPCWVSRFSPGRAGLRSSS